MEVNGDIEGQGTSLIYWDIIRGYDGYKRSSQQTSTTLQDAGGHWVER